jgi:uncharacterized linocin/CFP29 family protein
MTTNDPQVPWTDEQWARVNQVVQEEASRARVAATFLPLIGPLPGDADFVRQEVISYPFAAVQPPPNQMFIDDRNIWQLATLQVRVQVRGAQMADPDLTSVLAMLRRAANVLARLEDTVVFNGLVQPGGRGTPVALPVGVPGPGPGRIWEITGGEAIPGLLNAAIRTVVIGGPPPVRTERLVRAVSQAIGYLEDDGQFGPFAIVLGQALFMLAQTPQPTSLVLPQDRIIPFLGGGSLLRSTTLPVGNGVVIALGSAPIELVLACDLHVQFLQRTPAGEFLFRLYEKMVLRIKEPQAIVKLQW